jgi:uncharacterized membrane protein
MKGKFKKLINRQFLTSLRFTIIRSIIFLLIIIDFLQIG